MPPEILAQICQFIAQSPNSDSRIAQGRSSVFISLNNNEKTSIKHPLLKLARCSKKLKQTLQSIYPQWPLLDRSSALSIFISGNESDMQTLNSFLEAIKDKNENRTLSVALSACNPLIIYNNPFKTYPTTFERITSINIKNSNLTEELFLNALNNNAFPRSIRSIDIDHNPICSFSLDCGYAIMKKLPKLEQIIIEIDKWIADEQTQYEIDVQGLTLLAATHPHLKKITRGYSTNEETVSLHALELQNALNDSVENKKRKLTKQELPTNPHNDIFCFVLPEHSFVALAPNN